MKILSRYFVAEFLRIFFVCLFGLTFLFLAGRGLVQMADFIFNRSMDPILVLKLLYYSLPFMLIFIIPMAVLIASLMTFGKFSSENEILAMRASGVSPLKVYSPLFVLAIVLCLISFVLSDQVAATTHFSYRKLLSRIGIDNPTAVLEEGTFVKRFKNFVIFVYEINGNKLKGVRIYQPQEGRPTRTIIAQKGEVTSIPEQNIVTLTLYHGTSDEPDPKDPSKLYKLKFKTYDFPLNLSNTKDPDELGKKPKDMSIQELNVEIKRLKKQGIAETAPLVTEIHNKYALALSSLAFLLVGIPLGMTTRQSHRSISFGLALALMAGYWVLLIGGKSVAQKGLVPPFLAMQFANLILGAIGITLLWKWVKKE